MGSENKLTVVCTTPSISTGKGIVASTDPIPRCTKCTSDEWIYLGVKGDVVSLQCSGCKDALELTLNPCQ